MKKITKMILASCIILGLLFTTKPLYAENVETQDEYQMLMYDYQQEAGRGQEIAGAKRIRSQVGRRGIGSSERGCRKA